MSTRARRGSRIAVYLVEGTGCGGCALEAQAALAARNKAARGRVALVESPAHADMLVVCGALPEALRAEVVRLMEAMPEPRLCVHLGDCAVDGMALEGAVAVPGCSPGPQEILAAVAAAWRGGAPCLAPPDQGAGGEGP